GARGQWASCDGSHGSRRPRGIVQDARCRYSQRARTTGTTNAHHLHAPVSPMGELDREPPRTTSRPLRCAVVGRGRLGTALAAALAGSGHEVEGPLGRGSGAPGCDVALLCVPDGEIAAAAAAVV